MRPPDDGPTVPVNVTPEDLHRVAQQFADTAGEFEKLRDSLWDGVRPAAGWAGVDEQARRFGQQFSDGYMTLETAIERARNVLDDISTGITIAARNHWLADQSAVPGATPGEPPWTSPPPGPLIPAEVRPFPIAGNAKDRYPPPFDAKIPAGDPERLRAGARAFYEARDVADAMASALYQALYSMFAHNDSEDLRALDEFWQRVGGRSDKAILTAIREGCDALGRALDEFANWIVDTDNEIDRALHDVIDNIFTGALIALALAALTEGLGTFFGLADTAGIGGELVVAVDGALTATNVTARLAAIGGAVGGAIGLIQVAIDNTPSPDLRPTDPQVVTDSQITSEAGDLADIADSGLTREQYEKAITDLQADSPNQSPITRPAAERMIDSPPGTTPEVAGEGGEGADILFKDQNGNVMLKREVKTTSGNPNSFGDEMSKLPKQFARTGGQAPEEAWFQVKSGTTSDEVYDLMRAFQQRRLGNGASLSPKYDGIKVTFIDQDGNIVGNFDATAELPPR